MPRMTKRTSFYEWLNQRPFLKVFWPLINFFSLIGYAFLRINTGKWLFRTASVYVIFFISLSAGFASFAYQMAIVIPHTEASSIELWRIEEQRKEYASSSEEHAALTKEADAVRAKSSTLRDRARFFDAIATLFLPFGLLSGLMLVRAFIGKRASKEVDDDMDTGVPLIPYLLHGGRKGILRKKSAAYLKRWKRIDPFLPVLYPGLPFLMMHNEFNGTGLVFIAVLPVALSMFLREIITSNYFDVQEANVNHSAMRANHAAHAAGIRMAQDASEAPQVGRWDGPPRQQQQGGPRPWDGPPPSGQRPPSGNARQW